MLDATKVVAIDSYNMGAHPTTTRKNKNINGADRQHSSANHDNMTLQPGSRFLPNSASYRQNRRAELFCAILSENGSFNTCFAFRAKPNSDAALNKIKKKFLGGYGIRTTQKCTD